MSLRRFVRVIPTATESRFPVTGDLVYLRAATAGVLVTLESRRNDQGSEVFASAAPLSSRQKIKLPLGKLFDDVTIRNESGSDNTIEILIGEGDYDAPLSSVSLTTANTALAEPNVTANAAGVQLVASNPLRTKIWVGVLPSALNGAFLAESQAAAAAGKGLPMEPGIAYPIETTTALFVARNGANDVQVNSFELSST